MSRPARPTPKPTSAWTSAPPEPPPLRPRRLGSPLAEARKPDLFRDVVRAGELELGDTGPALTYRTAEGGPSTRAHTADRPRLVDAASGYIDSLLLTLPSDLDLCHPNVNHFRSLVESLGPGTTYVLLHNESAQQAVDDLRSDDITDDNWRSIVTPFDLDIWAQDPYAVMTLDGDDESSLLVEGVMFRETGMVVADEVMVGLGVQDGPLVRAGQSTLFFEGGNLLATPRHVLVGKEHLARNLYRPGLADQRQVCTAFSNLFAHGRENLIPLGTREVIEPEDWWGDPLTSWFQPIFHIDMHVTPTGAVAEDGREILLYGTPSAVEDRGRIPQDFRLQKAFCEVRCQLDPFFNIVDLPLLPVCGDAGQRGWESKRYYRSWNNVLLESFENGDGGIDRHVYVPVFDDPLDEVAQEIWGKAGFQVHPLSNMEDLAWAGGSAHCITKVLRRTGS